MTLSSTPGADSDGWGATKPNYTQLVALTVGPHPGSCGHCHFEPSGRCRRCRTGAHLRHTSQSREAETPERRLVPYSALESVVAAAQFAHRHLRVALHAQAHAWVDRTARELRAASLPQCFEFNPGARTLSSVGGREGVASIARTGSSRLRQPACSTAHLALVR